MKAFTIVRHTKAQSSPTYAVDFERPLADQGRKDAELMGRVLAYLSTQPDWLVSSPAARAKETTMILAQALNLTDSVQWEETIYEASVDALLSTVQSIPLFVNHLVLVGHNPGLTGLLAEICAGVTPRLNVHLPPGGLAHLHLDIYQWPQLRRGCAQLRLLLSPKVARRIAK